VKFFLGVDGGQSGTTALIGDEQGRIAGWATAGPCNHVAAAEARAKFLRVMRECIGQAAKHADLSDDDNRWNFESACLGMSGGPDDKADLFRELLAANYLLVTHDALIALAGANSGKPGIIVISGTGSIAFGQNERGETARTGGWGYIFGDEGSGFDIARQALRAILREHEGWGARTALTPALLAATGAADANAMLHLFYKPEWPRARVATLASIVDRVAEEGDPIAIGVLRQASQQLAMLAASVRSQIFDEAESTRVGPRISWAGGVFESRSLLERFRSLVSLDGDCQPPEHGPAWGALLLAYRAAGSQVVLQETPAG
jgi:N-acetylglucosamine kinase-like BadF-type ATPase